MYLFISDGERIAKCMLEKSAGCDNDTRLSLAKDIRNFAVELAKYYRAGKCNFSEIVIEMTNPLVPNMYNDSCHLQFASHFTAVMMNASASHWDVCMVLNETRHCLEKESAYLPALLQGVWKTAMHKIDLDNCYSGFGMKLHSLIVINADNSKLLGYLTKFCLNLTFF